MSTQHADKIAQIAAQRLSGGTPEPTPPWVNEGAVRAVLGDLCDTLKVCVGGCAARLLGYPQWQALDKGKRQRLRELGINRVSSYGRCWKCTELGAKKGESGRKYYGPKVTEEMKARIPEIWAEIQTAGGATPELGKRLGVTRERARQLVHELGLPHTDARNARTQVFLEELEFLAGFRLGAHEIAQRLGTTADALVQRVDRLRARGLTTVSFPQYHVKEWSDAA